MWTDACLGRSCQNGETGAQSPEEEERWKKRQDQDVANEEKERANKSAYGAYGLSRRSSESMGGESN